MEVDEGHGDMSDSFDLSEQFPPSPDRRGAALATLKKARDDYKTGDTPVRNYVHKARTGPTTQAQVDIQTTPERILHKYHCSTSHQRREPRCSRHLPARLNAIPKTPYSPARSLLVAPALANAQLRACWARGWGASASWASSGLSSWAA